VQRAITLSAERRECNADSVLAVRYDWGDDPGVAAGAVSVTLALQRIDARRIPRDLQSPPAFPSPWDGSLRMLALAGLQDAAGAPASFVAGDTLQLVLAVHTAERPPQTITLGITVVEEPVTPATEAGYALLRARQMGAQTEVQCARFAWGPAPARVELVNPEDLRTEIVRRRAVFQWVDSVRRGASGGYAIQKLTPAGSTHFPTDRLVPQAAAAHDGDR
jgi:hypothetical protein